MRHGPSRAQSEAPALPVFDEPDFVISDFPWHGSRLAFRTPLVLHPQVSESTHLLVLRDDDWHIHVLGETREQLQAELDEQLGMLWTEYAIEDNANLTASARAFKSRLVAAVIAD